MKYKLFRNWNGNFAGDEVDIPDHLGHLITNNKIGERIEPEQVAPEPEPLNKMIAPEYKKRGRKKVK
jgi:hypothetical protein